MNNLTVTHGDRGAAMDLRTNLFVGGQWVSSPHRFPVSDPATGAEIATVALADEALCEAAITAAHDSMPEWCALAPRDRSEVLRRCFELMMAEAEELALLVTRENGKALADSRAEIAYAAEFFRWFAEEAVRIAGDYRISPGGDKTIVIEHQPVGVSLLITPWNFPAAMATRKLAPALAAGCATILKPAAETPLTALAIVDLMSRAGVPDGIVNVVLPHDVRKQVKTMLDDPRVRCLSFTGSTEVGRELLHGCADTVVRASMELGGNAPFLVLEGADVDRAVDGAMIAKMRNGGSACTAANRFYVHTSLAEDFVRGLTDRMDSIVMGPGADPGTQLGSLVSQAERDKVALLVDDALSAGARRTTKATPCGKGAFYPATVLAEVSEHSPILKSEIFGPVAPVVECDDANRMIELANETEYGLIAYVYGPEGDAMRVAHRLESGMVAVNRGVASDPAASFGGVKQSGIGREGGFDGIHEFLETKYIALDVS
jgi:succinate-semialdehyde dehydrogenase / glutarate-semialdehyde dehydrogenase